MRRPLQNSATGLLGELNRGYKQPKHLENSGAIPSYVSCDVCAWFVVILYIQYIFNLEHSLTP